MELYDAINFRKSTREYSPESIGNESLQVVRGIIDNTERLYNNIEMKIHLVENGQEIHNMLPGIIGAYGRIRAPHYLLVTSEEKEGYLQNIGYALQGVVLMLTTIGLATCWLGANIKNSPLLSTVDIPEGQLPQLMIAFGNPAEGKSPFRENPSDAKRKTLQEIASGNMDVTWRSIAEAIRLAPSGVNAQPWRLVFGNGKVHVYSVLPGNPILRHFMGSLNLIDSGIALCHAMISARHFSKNIRFIEDPSAINKKYQYITTIVEV